MTEEIGGLHHVTAITGDARGNLEFYTRLLGMRLVKKTVNQDDVSAYHLFYADALGSPGTDVTFFDWPHAAPNRPGAGTIGPIALRVQDEGALGWWRERFESAGVPHSDIDTSQGRASLDVSDPEGQRLRLVADGGVPGGKPWDASPVPAEAQVKGLQGVTITEARPDLTRRFLELAGFDAPEIRHLPLVWRLSSAGDVFDALSRGGVRTAAVLRAQTPAALAAIRADIEREVAGYAQDDGFVVPMPAMLAAAVKSA